MHEGRGAESIKWRLGPDFGEDSVDVWRDPGAGVGNKKQSLLNLTAKPAFAPLNNAKPDYSRCGSGSVIASAEEAGLLSGEGITGRAHVNSYSKSMGAHPHTLKKKVALRSLVEKSAESSSASSGEYYFRPGTHDGEAGSTDRTETCIVNAAIMANSWGGPKRFNKPIVVDIDLPVWREDDKG